jgi:hypothetical protein
MDNLEPKFMTDRFRILRGKVSLDLLRLDENTETLPSLIQESGECAGYAMEIRDTLKEDLKFVYATEFSRLKSPPEGKTPSDVVTDNEVIASDAYQQKLKEYQEARLDAMIWQNLANSLDKKSFSINTSAQLIISGYITRDSIIERRRKEIRTA